MPVNNAQLAAGSNYSILAYAANKPVDQFTTAHPFSQWLIANKKESVFGNGIFNEKVRISNSSNYQNFQFDDQVTYNKKDTVRLAPFQHYEAHDGFTLNETELANNGIIMTDDKNAVPTEAEKIQIVSLVEEGMETLTNGFQLNWDQEVTRDGTQSTKAVPGLDNLISTTPTVGVIGGIDSATNVFWQNRVNLNIASTSGTLTQAMEKTYRDCSTVGPNAPDKIFCGSKFLDAYRNDAPLTVQRQMMLNTDQGVKGSGGGFNVDNGSSKVYFKGIELVWNPVFDILQSLLNPTIAWDKRCYFLNSKSIILRPFKGRWMVNRKPARVYDRYSHYFALTADYGLTLKQRNNMAVLSIA